MIPIFSLDKQNKLLEDELHKAIRSVIDSGVYILGSCVSRFEEAFAKYLGVKYAIGVASGTDALSLALLSAGVGPGDEVILPANSYPTVFAITAIGAIPKLVDINSTTYNIDPVQIPQVVTLKTKAIIPVHLYGQAADCVPIKEYLRTLNQKIYLIEDCCQAHGGEIRINSSITQLSNKKRLRHLGGGSPSADGHDSPDGGGIWRKVGSIGDIGCFSFYPTKNLGCFGDGGMVVTNNEEIAQKIKLLRMYGEEKRYKSVMLGRNSRLDELQAAILLVKLKYLDIWNEKRRKIANWYLQYLGGSCHLGTSDSFTIGGVIPPAGGCHPRGVLRPSIKLPFEASYARHVYHLFVIRTKKRDQLKAYLEEKGIQTAIHYPAPIHLQPSFKYLGYKKGDFPEAEKACGEILSLPMFPELTREEVKQVVERIAKFSLQLPHTGGSPSQTWSPPVCLTQV